MTHFFRSLLVVASAIVFASSAHAQTTALFYDSQPGDYIGQGARQTITSNDATFSASVLTDGVRFSIIGPAFVFFYYASFSVNGAAPVSAGVYESTRRWPFAPLNGLDVESTGKGCNESTGRFVILELVYAPDGSVSKFAADFEQHCEGATPALFGALRYNSTISDLRPFGGQYPVYSVSVTAADHGVVTGPGLSCRTGGIGCHATFFTPAIVQLTATPDPGYIFTGWTGDCHGLSTVPIIVYGPRVCGATFDTIVPTSPRTILFWNSAAGDYIGGGQSDIYSPQNSLWSATAEATLRGITVNVTGVTDTGEADWMLEFRAPVGNMLQVGQYLGATRAAFATTTPGIDIFGSGRGCNTTAGQFTVREIEFGPGPTITNLALDFEQHCEGVTIPPIPPLSGTIEINSTLGMPTTRLSKTSLSFATTVGAARLSLGATPPQKVTLTESDGGSAVSWSASTDQPWLSVTPAFGSGAADLTVSIRSDVPLPGLGTTRGHVTLALSDSSNNPGPIAVTVSVLQSGTTHPPFGSFDTPLTGAAGLFGSIAVTGWALDDVGVSAVRIVRDPVAGETPGQGVPIGNAVLVDGARPDVAAAYPTMPRNTDGGWGYLLLTNFLPNGGNGTFTLHAFADDIDGHTTLLGTKTITCDNADSKAPFGAIDTPGQGDVTSGIVANFGWVLSPGARRSDPPGGGTVTVFVDGVPAGSPGGWASRSDLLALFPVALYSGVDTALGVFSLDTTTLADGVHTIAWSVTDNLGLTSGIGSRFFTVSNAASVLAAPSTALASTATHTAPGMDTIPGRGTATILMGRRGFDLTAPLEYFFPDKDGVVTIESRELDRIELQLEPGSTGALITALGLRPLPAGGQLDRTNGIFTWAPGPGFVGSYDFVLGGRRVRIVLRPGTDSHNVPRR
jgi:hypothetical protein